jgi:hypothetical protein
VPDSLVSQVLQAVPGAQTQQLGQQSWLLGGLWFCLPSPLSDSRVQAEEGMGWGRVGWALVPVNRAVRQHGAEKGTRNRKSFHGLGIQSA